MLLLLTGHPRSGTAMMLHLCNSHPQVGLTLELGTLRTLWVHPRLYALSLLEGWRATPAPPLQFSGNIRRGWSEHRQSIGFMMRFLSAMRAYRHRLVGPAEVEACYHRCLPGRRVVGDKLPNYSLCLDQYARVQGLRCVVIYRHVFSVIDSYLQAVAGKWRHVPTLNHLNTPERVASQWVESIHQLQRHRDAVLALKYEQLLSQPEPALESLGRWLEVDPSGFRRSILGRPRPPIRFEPAVEARILEIAGPALRALGYADVPESR